MLTFIVLSCIVVILGLPVNAHAYLDPGTGSMLASALISIVAIVLFAIKTVYYNGTNSFLTLLGKTRKRTHASLVFYSEGKQYWNTFKPVLDALSASDEKCTYLTSDADDPGLQHNISGLTAKFIGKKGNKAFSYLNMLEADICIMTTPGLDVLQILRSPGVKHYMHIVHGLGDTSMYRLYALDYYDSVCISGDYQKISGQELEQIRGTKPKIYFQSGCPYFDVLMEKKSDMELKKDNVESPCILIAPTWGVNGLLSRYGKDLLQNLAEAGYKIIIRPHPQSHTAEPKLIKELQEKTKQFSNVTWDYAIDNFETMLAADVLISDYSGIIYDFAFIMEKPVLTMDFEPNTEPYDAADIDTIPWDFKILENFGKRISLKDIPKIPEIISDMLKSDTFKNDLIKLRAENVYNFGCAGSVIAKQILDVRISQRESKPE